MKIKLNLYKTAIVTLIVITIFSMIDSYRSRHYTDNEKEIENINIAGVENPEVKEPIGVKVCEYIDILHEDIQTPGLNDDIQENIGYQNNKVGLYIYAEVHEFSAFAEKMVNANGGDWGYVLIPYNVKDYDETRWGELFQILKTRHLIPIIQLWDLDLEENKKEEQIKDSADFLNSLQWPIKNRYISVYNEPNDAKFWKGNVNPEEYAEVLEDTINTFKALNKDYFMLNGAFNSSARTNGDYLDEQTFLVRMNNQVPGIFKRLDGWASHPYPQPNFSGSPNGRGRDSIRAYEWELDILRKQFSVDIENLPVFITETGWAHKESDAYSNGNSVDYSLDQYKVADYFVYAFENVWLPDDRVVAVTPFTIWYEPPFDHFSWITKNHNTYPQYEAIKNMKKVEGKPPVVDYIKTKILDCKPGIVPKDKEVEIDLNDGIDTIN